MQLTQLVNFELSSHCEYAERHPFCPASKMERPRGRMTDEFISAAIVTLYKLHDFGGMIGFHWYCEPWNHKGRMFNIVDRVIAMDSSIQPRFLLWSNAERHVIADIDHPKLEKFEQVHLTAYQDMTRDKFQSAMRNVSKFCPNVWPHIQNDDGRTKTEGTPKPGPCFRPFLEMTFDSNGQLRPCCYGWKESLGELGKESLGELVERWKKFRSSLADPSFGYHKMSNFAPNYCKLCGHRDYELPCVDPYIAAYTGKVLEKERDGAE